MSLPKVELWTDGATSGGNPGVGGYAAVMTFHQSVCAVGGFSHWATNNEMEATAVYAGLLKLKFPCEVDLYTDSTYVFNGMRRLLQNKMPLQTNKHVWVNISALLERCPHQVNLKLVRGHNGILLNHMADKLAKQCANKRMNYDKVSTVEELKKELAIRLQG